MKIIAKNYQCKLGELDLVAAEGETVVFVEVRSTERADSERAALSINHAKQKRLSDLAAHFLRAHRLEAKPARFDVVLVSWPPLRPKPEMTHHRNAFDQVRSH